MKSVFEKGYLPNWTEENFTVAIVDRKRSPIMYRLVDYNGDLIEGSFYRHKIQPIVHNEDDDLFMVEKVIQRKRRGGENWALVKWLGYPSSMNSWVRQTDLQHVAQRF